MRIKDNSVIWDKFDLNFYPRLDTIDTVFRQFCFENFQARLEPVMTSGRDSSHMTGSLHYEGKACDIRLLTHEAYNLEQTTNEDNKQLVDKLKEVLGKDFNIVLEHDHIHIELDPKT